MGKARSMWIAPDFDCCTLSSVLGGFVFVFLLTACLGTGADKGLSNEFPWQFRLAAQLRTPVLMFIVVPLSYVKGKYTVVRRRYIRYMRGVGGPEAAIRHEANVTSIQAQLRAW